MNLFLIAFVRRLFVTALALLVFSPLAAQAQTSEKVARGVEWLNTQVQPNGALANEAASIATPLQNRSEVAHTLKILSNVPAQLLDAVENEAEANTEYLTRRIVTLSLAGKNTSILLPEIYSRQNPDGGFGGAHGYSSNPADTAYVLLALQAAGTSASPSTAGAVSYLLSSQNADGGFSLARQESNVFLTALVSRALQLNSQVVTVIDSVSRANNWLLSRQQADGGWGHTAVSSLVYFALLGTHSDSTLQSQIITAILAQQVSDGSWNGDPFATALALRALTAKPTIILTTGNVTGSVIDGATGQPFMGANVSIEQIAGAALTSNMEGKFEFIGIAAGKYTVIVSSIGYASKKAEITLQPGTTINLGPLVMTPSLTSGVIRGSVTDAATGLPLAGAAITVSGAATASTTTLADGSYKLINLAPGAITISASKNGYASVGGNGTIAAGSVLVFSPSLKMQSSVGAITGQVVDSATQMPLAGVTVVVEGSGLATATGGDGYFNLNGVPAGTVLVTFSLDGYTSNTIAAVINAGGLTDFRQVPFNKIGPPSTTATVSGVVNDNATKQPLAGVLISIAGTGALSAMTATDGSFSIAGIAPGAITVTASKSGYESAAGSADVSAGATLIFSPNLNVSEGGALSGQVLDATGGASIVGAIVTIGNAGSATTDAEGRFIVTAIPAGSHVASFTKTGYTTRALSVFVSEGAASDLKVIELSKSMSSVALMGQVTDLTSGQPIANALINVLGTDLSASTDNDGLYRIEGISIGTLSVRYSAQGYTSDTVMFDFESAGEYLVDRPLRAGQGSDINLALGTDKPNYPAYNEAAFNIDVQNNGGQATKGTVGIRVLNENGKVIDSIEAAYVDSKGDVQRIFEFAPGLTPITVTWNTGASTPGTYTAVTRLYQASDTDVTFDVIELAQRQTSFVIDPTQAILAATITPLPSYTNLDAMEQVGFRLEVVNRSNIATSTEFTYELRTPSDSLGYTSKFSLQLDPSESGKSVLLPGFEYKFDQSGLYTTSMTATAGVIPHAIEVRSISVSPGTRIDPKHEVSPTVVTPDGDKRIRVDVRLQGVEQK